MARSDRLRLALHSAPSRLGDVEANVAAVVAAVKARDADVVVFPELFLSGYNIGDDVQRLALQPDDERLEPLLKAAARAKCCVVVGAPRRARAGVHYNAAALVGADGSLQWYDKRALATFTTFREGLFFGHGRTSPVWQTPWGKVGIGICYDLFFPEFHRQQSIAGADLLLNISASPATSRRFFEALLPARAVENASFVAYTNLVGAQDGVVFWGGAQAWGPRGDARGRLEPYSEGRLLVELDAADLEPARQFRPTLRDADAESVSSLDAGAPRDQAARRASSTSPTSSTSSASLTSPSEPANGGSVRRPPSAGKPSRVRKTKAVPAARSRRA